MASSCPSSSRDAFPRWTLSATPSARTPSFFPPSLAARVCLITDVEQLEEDRAGRITDRLDLLHGVDPGTPDRCWTWDLAPYGEAARHLRQRHRVMAFLDWCGPRTRESRPEPGRLS